MGQSNVPREKSHPRGRAPAALARFSKEPHHRRAADDSLSAKMPQASNVIRLEFKRKKRGRGKILARLMR